MLGRMGPIPDSIIIQIGINSSDLNQINNSLQALGEKPITVTNLRSLLETIVYNPLESFMFDLIDQIVPVDTGDLQRSMKTRIRDGKQSLRNFSPAIDFIMHINASVSYAKPVNRMPTAWLTHPAEWHKNTGRTGLPLNDPGAEKGWFNIIVLKSRNWAMILYRNFIKNIVSLLQPLSLQFRNLPAIARALFKTAYK